MSRTTATTSSGSNAADERVHFSDRRLAVLYDEDDGPREDLEHDERTVHELGPRSVRDVGAERITRSGFLVQDVADAPDRPGRALVLLARCVRDLNTVRPKALSS